MGTKLEGPVLVSAYACEPERGSEPGVGWNIAWQLSERVNTWVVTRANNRQVIEDYLGSHPRPNLQFIYYDLPAWLRSMKRGEMGIQVYYYLWQIGAYFKVRKIHIKMPFPVVQHVTFVKYWAPSLMSLLSARFIWGPVGGGDATPPQFLDRLGARGRFLERLRALGQWIGEHDPLVHLTARRSRLALATTGRTCERVRHLGAIRVELFSQVGLTPNELERLGRMSLPEGPPFRFISIGRLHHCKGFDLGLRAFSKLERDDWEFWIVGDGPERTRLEELSDRLGISRRIRFLGHLPRVQALQALGSAHILVHPSLHDSGGWVCAEAMAAGRPVICLDLGGPPSLIGAEAGVAVVPRDPDSTVEDLAKVMRRLADDSELRVRMGRAGRARARSAIAWETKGKDLLERMSA